MKDILGYNREIKSADIASSEFAAISIGSQNSKEALVQTISFNYTQQISETVQVGDPNIYMTPGRPSGSCTIDKLVGEGGFFAGFKDGVCGVVSGASVTLGGGACGFKAGGTLAFSKGIIQSLSTTVQAQQLQIGSQVVIRFASLLST